MSLLVADSVPQLAPSQWDVQPPIDLENLMIPTGGIDGLDEDENAEEEDAQAERVDPHLIDEDDVGRFLADFAIGSAVEPDEDDAGGTEAGSALTHFARHVANCTCDARSCISRVKGAEELALSFRALNQVERALRVRAMLLVTSSGSEDPNDLVNQPWRRPERREKRRRDSGDVAAREEPNCDSVTYYGCSVYALRGVYTYAYTRL